MAYYPLLIFLHISGAVLMFVALGVEAVAVRQLGEVSAVGAVHSWNGVRRRWGWAGVIAIVAVLASGIWMMALRWGPQAWIITGFAGLLVIVIASVVAGVRARTRLLAAMARNEEISRPILRAVADSLTFAVRLRAGVGIAVLGLMTLRPGPFVSITMLTAPIALVIVHRVVTVAGRRSVAAGIAES